MHDQSQRIEQINSDTNEENSEFSVDPDLEENTQQQDASAPTESFPNSNI